MLLDRDAVGTHLARSREEHRGELDALTADCDQSRKDIAALNVQRSALAEERDQAVAHLAQLRETHSKSLAAHSSELEHIIGQRDGLSMQLAKVNGAHHQEAREFVEQIEALTEERNETASALAQSQAGHRRDVDALVRERDSAILDLNAISEQFTRAWQEHEASAEGLSALRASLSTERDRIVADHTTLLEAHDREVQALTAERDALVAARDELRGHLDAATHAPKQELETMRREHGAIVRECAEAVSLLERDRAAWRKQIELFTEERDTLVRERDELVAELHHERQSDSKQLELRTHECETLAQQRDGIQAQLNDLQEAQRRQVETFNDERKLLIAEREGTASKLDQALMSLGADRATLLEQRTDAIAQLESATESHQQALVALGIERDAVLAERDAVLGELQPIRETASREEASLGTLAARKYQPSETIADDGLSVIQIARDTVIGRDVDFKVIHLVSEKHNAALLDEARRLGRLQHSNIPPIYEVGLDESGRVFYTMKAVTGMSLREVLGQLEGGKTASLLHFTLKRLLGVFHKACDAVAFAHAHGVTHGALKPEHIILGDFGEVFVTHWNLSRTSTFGTGRAQEIDPLDDIAALGRLLFEIATLKPAPDFIPPRRDSAGQRHEPAARDRQTHTPQAQHWAGDNTVSSLISVAKHALDKRAADKFTSVKEFQMRVDAFKDSFHDPVSLTLQRLLVQWARLQRQKLLLVAAVFVLIIVLWIASALLL